jgi:dihydrofolate synthase/folylpolyglutamate synthase
VDRRILTEAGIVRYVEELRPVAEKLGEEDAEWHPTFFEFVAAMAFLRFATEQVDIALIETGLGGRLDATNVVEPELSIITSISFDHMDLLGDTLAKIATEKAGIIKPGKPVLIGCLPEEAEAVIRVIAAERGSPFYTVRERFREADLPETNLAGHFQRWNAAVAVYATELLAERFPVQSTEALMQIDWPGRWQKIEVAGRTLILDATHNPEGAVALVDNLKQVVASESQSSWRGRWARSGGAASCRPWRPTPASSIWFNRIRTGRYRPHFSKVACRMIEVFRCTILPFRIFFIEVAPQRSGDPATRLW